MNGNKMLYSGLARTITMICERLKKATQHSVHPTGGSRRVFWQLVWLETGSVKAASHRPAHPQVTHSVRRLNKGKT